MIWFRTRSGSSLVALLGAAALALLPSSALAVGGQHTTLASLQANIRANSILEPFNGPDSPAVPSIAFGSGGFQATLDSENPAFGIFRTSTLGVGSASPAEGTKFTFTGRPVSAFGGTFRVNNGTLTSVGGTISVVTDTGESFTFPVPVAGQFFAITTARPFTSVTFNTVPAAIGFETIDDAYVGIAANALELTDQCADAETISPFGAEQYPFTTVGATPTPIAGSCATADTGADVWFRFLPTVTGNVDISTCGASFDTILRVFDTCTSTPHLFCNDDSCTGGAGALASRVQFRCVAGEDYLIRISGFGGATGSGNLTFSVVPDCRADFNHNGGKEVQDIFDFLAAWFGAC